MRGMPTPASLAARPFFPDNVRPRGAPAEAFFRAIAALVMADGGDSPARVARQAWPRDDGIGMVLRGASAPGDSSTSGWAAQLVATQNGEWVSSLRPSVFGQIAPQALQLSLANGALPRLPGREATPTIAGSFVAEGAAIPVRRLNLNVLTFAPKRMKVITTVTNELRRGSVPDAEAVVRSEVVNDTANAVDSVLLDATAATSIRPAGLRAGVTVTTATAGGGVAALVGDLKGLLGAISPAVRPCFVMNPVQAISVALMGGLALSQGVPVIQSSNVAAGLVLALDLDSFVSASEPPTVTVSEEAVVHEEDSAPLPISTAGGVLAAPVRSLFQSDVIALRLVWPLDWKLRRTGSVAFTEATTW